MCAQFSTMSKVHMIYTNVPYETTFYEHITFLVNILYAHNNHINVLCKVYVKLHICFSLISLAEELLTCGKIRLIECSSKLRYLEKFTCKGTLRQVFYLSEAPPPPLTLPYTLYTCIQYTYSHREGGGEGN
jgi:hypothetical protein